MASRGGAKVSAAQRLTWKAKFQEYDKSGDGKLDKSELGRLLRAGNPDITDAEVTKLFKQVDRNNDGTIDFEEFVDFLCDMSSPTETLPEELKAKFQDQFGCEMDRNAFMKFCSEAKLFSKLFQQSDAQDMFDRARIRGKQTVATAAWEKLLNKIAEQSKRPFSEICDQVLKSKAWSVPAKSDNDSQAVDGRRRSSLMIPQNSANRARRLSGSSIEMLDAEEIEQEEALWPSVEATFTAFSRSGPPMTGPEFARLFDECLFLVDGKIKRAECDIIFSQYMNSNKKLDFAGFKKAVRTVASKKDMSVKLLQQKIALTKEPKPMGTQFDEVSHMTDPKAYKRKGNPTNFDIGPEGPWGWVKKAFESIESNGGLDTVQFRRVLLDSSVLDASFSQAEADIIYTATVRQRRNITFEDFQNLLREVAKRKQRPISEIQQAVGYS